MVTGSAMNDGPSAALMASWIVGHGAACRQPEAVVPESELLTYKVTGSRRPTQPREMSEQDRIPRGNPPREKQR